VPEIRPQTVIGDRYRLDSQASKGAMGAVWRGFDKKLRRIVAVKVLHPKWAASAEARMRFEREAMAVAQLSCPQVVQIFDYGVHEGAPFIVMELLDGEDLQERLKREKQIAFEYALEIVWQTAKALGVAHGAGIVHRDLKPANVFLATGEGEIAVKVLDFGVAKLLDHQGGDDEATREGLVVGTPHYMSPEQARGLPGTIDHRADLWSLGAITYRMLTGRLPFRGKSPTDVIIALLTHQPFEPATRVAPHLPPEIDAFFERALAREPHARFQTAKELAVALGQIAPDTMPSLQLPLPAGELLDAIGEASIVETLDSDAARRIAIEAPQASPPRRHDAGASLPGVLVDPEGLPPKRRWLWWAGAALVLGLAGLAGRTLLAPSDVASEATVAAEASEPAGEPQAETTAHEEEPPTEVATPVAEAPAPTSDPADAGEVVTSKPAPTGAVPAIPHPVAPPVPPPVVVAPPPPPPAATPAPKVDPYAERL
jgi:eukaryotic-like serine/threonine-protein kinase